MQIAGETSSETPAREVEGRLETRTGPDFVLLGQSAAVVLLALTFVLLCAAVLFPWWVWTTTDFDGPNAAPYITTQGWYLLDPLSYSTAASVFLLVDVLVLAGLAFVAGELYILIKGRFLARLRGLLWTAGLGGSLVLSLAALYLPYALPAATGIAGFSGSSSRPAQHYPGLFITTTYSAGVSWYLAFAAAVLMLISTAIASLVSKRSAV